MGKIRPGVLASAAAGNMYRAQHTSGIVTYESGVTLNTGEGKANARTVTGWTLRDTKQNNKSTKGARRGKRCVLSDRPEEYPTGTTYENASHQPSAGVSGGRTFTPSDDPSNDKVKAQIKADRAARAQSTRKANKANAEIAAQENAALDKRRADSDARTKQYRVEHARQRAEALQQPPQSDGPLSKVEATRLFRAAMGAMHQAQAVGDFPLAEKLHEQARAYRRITHRAAQNATPPPVEPSALHSIPAKDIPAEIKALAKEAVGAAGWYVVGARGTCEGFCRLYAKRHGASLRFADYHAC